MKEKKFFKTGTKYQDRNELARLVSCISEAYCDPNFHNGPACDWGGAIVQLGVELMVSSPTFNALVQEERLQCTSHLQGGLAFGNQHNTNVLYIRCIEDEDKRLNLRGNADFEFFDTKLYCYTESLIKKRCPVASTKIRHNFMLGFEEIVFLVGECESNSFHEELIRIILCLVQMLVYLDVAYGFIVTGHIIYVVRAKLCNDQYEYHVLPWQYHPERLSCENDVKMANYIVGVMEIIRWVASIVMHQQLNLAEIKKKYKSRRVKPEGRK